MYIALLLLLYIYYIVLLEGGSNLNSNKENEWRQWFSLPYITHPETDTFFAPYFHDDWYVFVSLFFLHMHKRL